MFCVISTIKRPQFGTTEEGVSSEAIEQYIMLLILREDIFGLYPINLVSSL